MGAAPREAAKDGGEEGLRSGELSVLLWASPSEGSPQAPPFPCDTVSGAVAAAAVCLRAAEQGGQAGARNP